MPRGATAAKRQQGAANQRDTRHESGLVGPGKRIQKQKSNGHLNGHARSSEPSTTTPPLPGTPSSPNGQLRHPLPADRNADHKMNGDNARRGSFSGDSEFSSAESSHNTPAISVSHENHHRIDVNAAKNPDVHRDVGALGYAKTVLQSCPLYDTIAILLILLQLPPTFLSLVHLLFATLTFVPPANPTASAVTFSFSDMFEGSMSTPSFFSILFIDILVLLIWLFLWSPLQEIALELAQTVIALTLGGGASGKDAGRSNMLMCFGVIGASHLSRSGHVNQSGIRALLSTTTNGLLGSPDLDDPLEQVAENHKRPNGHTWIRSILAIHILTQGVVRYVREWLMRKKRDTSVDPEAAKSGVDSGTDINGSPNQSTSDSATLPTSQAQVTSKKKKKESAQVRLRQPLWSALASTKIVMVKEYETSHTAAESATISSLTGDKDLPNALFEQEADMIWITYIGPDEVFFSTSYFPSHSAPEVSNQKLLDAGVDQSKPFFVRVNNTIWQPTRINLSDEGENVGEVKRWHGEIFGLAPMSNYQCDFVSTLTGRLLFSSNVRTLSPVDVAVGLAPNPTFNGRPGSPTSTLKASIASSEIKLNEEKARQKKERKEQRARLTTLRKDIEKLGNSITSGGGNEDRQRQKHQQHLSHMKQAEEAILEINAEIDNFEPISDDSKSQYSVQKREFQQQRDQHKQSLKTFNKEKSTADQEIQNLSAEVTALQSKRERLQGRISKLNNEHERITDANARGLSEVQRKEREYQDKEASRIKLEKMWQDSLSAHNDGIAERQAALSQCNSAIESLRQLELYSQVQTHSPTSSMPNLNLGYDGGIPEHNVAHNYPWPSAPIYPHAPQVYPSGNTSNPITSPTAPRRRGRTSSMHSNVSGFTESSGEGPAQGPLSSPFASYPPGFGIGSHQSHPNANKAELFEDSTADIPYEQYRKQSSGSSSGNGSVGDPKSPISGNVQAVYGYSSPGAVSNGRANKW